MIAFAHRPACQRGRFALKFLGCWLGIAWVGARLGAPSGDLWFLAVCTVFWVGIAIVEYWSRVL